MAVGQTGDIPRPNPCLRGMAFRVDDRFDDPGTVKPNDSHGDKGIPLIAAFILGKRFEPALRSPDAGFTLHPWRSTHREEATLTHQTEDRARP
jgi:hypothetical protein